MDSVRVDSAELVITSSILFHLEDNSKQPVLKTKGKVTVRIFYLIYFSSVSMHKFESDIFRKNMKWLSVCILIIAAVPQLLS